MNILLWLAYKGTNYSGFQVQPNGVTVCAVVQDAMQSVFGTRPDVKGCSRTDAGVHARRFALNFHYDGRIPVQRIPLALNARLPMDVRALAAQQVPDDFHARYAAHAKTYHYRLRCSAVDDPFDYETCHRVNGPLDLTAMQAAAARNSGRLPVQHGAHSDRYGAAGGPWQNESGRCACSAAKQEPRPGRPHAARQGAVFVGCAVPGFRAPERLKQLRQHRTIPA